MYQVIVHRHAVHYLHKLSQEQQRRIKRILNEIGANPFVMPDIKNMVGEWLGYHRIRVGNIRIIFWVDKDKKIVYIDHIGPRGDVYKK